MYTVLTIKSNKTFVRIVSTRYRKTKWDRSILFTLLRGNKLIWHLKNSYDRSAGWWNAKWQVAQTIIQINWNRHWAAYTAMHVLCACYSVSSSWHYRIRNCWFSWRRPTMVSDSVTCCTRQWFPTANILAWWMWGCVKSVKWKTRPMI